MNTSRAAKVVPIRQGIVVAHPNRRRVRGWRRILRARLSYSQLAWVCLIVGGAFVLGGIVRW